MVDRFSNKMQVFTKSVRVMCTQTALRIHENSCTVLIRLHKNNLNLSIPHKPLCFKKIRLTTTTAVFRFQRSNSESLQPYCSIRSSILCSPNLKFKVRLIDLSQSDIQILCGLQIDNGIRQCVNSSWSGIFKNKFVVPGQYIRFARPLLISSYQKWWRCCVNRLRSAREWKVVIMSTEIVWYTWM